MPMSMHPTLPSWLASPINKIVVVVAAIVVVGTVATVAGTVVPAMLDVTAPRSVVTGPGEEIEPVDTIEPDLTVVALAPSALVV